MSFAPGCGHSTINNNFVVDRELHWVAVNITKLRVSPPTFRRTQGVSSLYGFISATTCPYVTFFVLIQDYC